MTATILVVDDLERNIKLLEAKLLGEYYTVLSATSGLQALNVLENNKIDVILLDVMMPGMDGYETCKRIKANPATTHIPVVMVTALSEVEDKVKGLQAGADEFLTKPVNDTALFARVRSLSRIKTIIDELRLRNQTNLDLGLNEINLDQNIDECKIIILDDDAVQAKNVALNLLKITKNIKVTSDPGALYELIKEFTPHIIIINSQLEVTDPLRVCVNLRTHEELRNIPLIMLADDETIPLVIKGIELGVNDYFLYPVDENELMARIKTQLRRKQYQDILKNNLVASLNMSIRDGLTNIYNRRYFDAHINQMVNNAQKNAGSLMLMMLDIDHFKNINDQYGHQAGDEILKEFAAIIQNCTRLTDFAARYGGEEFALVLHNVDQEQTLVIAERIRETIANTEFIIGHSPTITVRITVSIGVAIYRNNLTIAEFIKMADAALYKAKNSGRNKVVIDQQ